MIDAPGRDALVFLPLGGSGEIGMNLNLYGYAGRWLMVDLGITFGDETTPGVDVILPDPSFIEEQREALAGLVLTHAHEDHIGAVPYIWPRLRCPLYATPFTAAVLRRKLSEAGIEGAPITEVAMSGRFSVGPFDLELITMTHSIPEPNALVIRTAAGTVLHTGDWKLDPEPLVGMETDEAALRRLGDDGVLAMVCDSTNALVSGWSGSEAQVRASLTTLLGRFKNRVAVTCFASNVARLESIARAAAAHDRQVALVGRSLWRIVQAARETGYLRDTPDFLSEAEAGYLPNDKILMICTGSQGEPRSALARIARQDHPEVVMERGDAVIFSSRVIPGNEKAIAQVQNGLMRLGIEVVGEPDHFVHVSGHPARDELATLYQWVRPKVAIPVHGELRHLRAHAKLAEACQVGKAVVVENGCAVRLAGTTGEVIGEVPAGRLAVDGTELVPLYGPAMRSRNRIIESGAAVVTLVVDRFGRVRAEPQLTLHALVDSHDNGSARDAAVDAIRDALEDLPPPDRQDDDKVREAARIAVRRSFKASHGKKPLTNVHLVRV